MTQWRDDTVTLPFVMHGPAGFPQDDGSIEWFDASKLEEGLRWLNRDAYHRKMRARFCAERPDLVTKWYLLPTRGWQGGT